MSGAIMRTFLTMMKMFSVYIKCKFEYDQFIWSPIKQAEINNTKKIQKPFTINDEGMEYMNYHEIFQKKVNNQSRKKIKTLIYA